jgi:AMMECR1 domain-containing protein
MFRISLLTDFEDIDRWDDWVLGTHGIYITFTPPSSTKSRRSSGRDTLTATYLPQVAEEQGWNQEEALDSAIAKAGYEGPVDEAFRQSVHVQRYQSRKCFVSWDEYVQWRQTHGETVEL